MHVPIHRHLPEPYTEKFRQVATAMSRSRMRGGSAPVSGNGTGRGGSVRRVMILGGPACDRRHGKRLPASPRVRAAAWRVRGMPATPPPPAVLFAAT